MMKQATIAATRRPQACSNRWRTRSAPVARAQRNKHSLAAAATLLCAAALAPLLVARAQHYGASLAPSYETAMLAPAADSGAGAPYGPSSGPCVLTIKPHNGTTAGPAYPSAPTSGADDSYLVDYAYSGRPAYAATATRYGAGGAAHLARTICITQHDVDGAVDEAKASLGGYVPSEIYTANSELPKPMHVSVVAEIITQATRILANRFKLPEPAILYDLPALDLSKSASIDKVCPVFLKPGVNCEQTKYRTLTGFCNNLQYQSWGSTRSAMVRFLAPDYYDSISLPRRAYDGSPLPSARVVSFVVHQDPPEYDKYHTMLSVVWGQFIDHDMTLAAQATDEQPTTADGKQTFDCCKSEDAHPDCFPIEIPKGDPFYGYFNQKCMHFTRASAGLQPSCSLGPVQALNRISSFMDGSLVYGSGIKTSNWLRTFHYGQLKSQPVSSERAYGSSAAYDTNSIEYAPETHAAGAGAGAGSVGAEYLVTAGSRQHQAQRAAHGLDVAASELTGAHEHQQYGQQQNSAEAAAALYGAGAGAGAVYKELLPANTRAPDNGCERRGRAKDVYCFEAGDVRANEQIQLTTLHTMFMREHNRLARALSYINAHWDDERLYQEARQIVVAQMQHITFNEFLPLVIGKDKIYEYGLELEHPGRYYHGYDAKINAGIRVEFQAAAFRYGHSILPSYIERYNKFHQKIESIRLSKLLKQPYDLYHPGVIDTYMLGLLNQRAGRMDPTLTTEVTNHLFEKPGKFFGIDLAAINIQRGRDMGVPGYNHFREYCGLPRATYFDDLSGVFSNKTLLRLSQLYKHVDDIDLWTAGISEYPIADGLVGPTFACLIARQFVNLRRGDRFWYENGPTPSPASSYSAPQPYGAQFTIEQLDEIRKSTAARLLCDNSDDIDTIQASAMLIPDAYTNPRVPCATLPQMDLSRWRERHATEYAAPPSFASSPPQSTSPSYHVPAQQYPQQESASTGPLSPQLTYGSAPQGQYGAPSDASAASEYVPTESRHHTQQAAGDGGSSSAQSAYEAAVAEVLGAANAHEYEPVKMSQHQFVEHLVETPHYRSEHYKS